MKLAFLFILELILMELNKNMMKMEEKRRVEAIDDFCLELDCFLLGGNKQLSLKH